MSASKDRIREELLARREQWEAGDKARQESRPWIRRALRANVPVAEIAEWAPYSRAEINNIKKAMREAGELPDD